MSTQSVSDDSDWISIDNRLPALAKPVKAQLQHWYTKNIVESDLVRVQEDDCSWRTADDGSEISYDWNVIAWKDL